MAIHKLTLKIKVHWLDKWFYLPFLRLVAMLGFEFDVQKALEPVAERMVITTLSGKKVKKCVRA